jgi:hypothetical protein
LSYRVIREWKVINLDIIRYVIRMFIHGMYLNTLSAGT